VHHPSGPVAAAAGPPRPRGLDAHPAATGPVTYGTARPPTVHLPLDQELGDRERFALQVSPTHVLCADVAVGPHFVNKVRGNYIYGFNDWPSASRAGQGLVPAAE